MPRLFSTRRPSPIPLLLLGAALFWLALGTVRYFAIPKTAPVHYHANFLMEISGQAINFGKPAYMEETSSCYLTSTPLYPRQRAHLHNSDGGTVHVHTSGVSWGQFFQSLYFNLGEHAIVDDQGIVYADSDVSKVTYVLNGKTVSSVTNTLIGNEDSLLVAYGTYSPEDLKKLVTMVPDHAHNYNQTLDPSACSSTPPETSAQHLRRSFLFVQ
jgi:hypothetical protein